MKTKLIQSVPAVFALLAVGFQYFSQWCILKSPSCYGTWIHHIYDGITSPAYFFALYLLPLTLILIFVPKIVFQSWLKLAVWVVVPLSFFFIATQPVNWMGIGINPFFISRDDMARYTAEVSTILSLILIAWKYYASRRANSVKV